MINFIENFSGISLIIVCIAYLIAITYALSSHEYAHAKVAFNQGDYTPKARGRLTLNPLKHINPIGFLCLLLVGFGWASPVEVNPINFKEYRKGFFFVSIAGVLTNFINAFLFASLYVLTLVIFSQITMINDFILYLFMFLQYLFYFSIVINLSLCIFNLLPVYPLDGFNIVQSFTRDGNKFMNFMIRYGSFILIGFVILDSILDVAFGSGIFSSVIGFVMRPLVQFWSMLI